jgi:hypothetical protein
MVHRLLKPDRSSLRLKRNLKGTFSRSSEQQSVMFAIFVLLVFCALHQIELNVCRQVYDAYASVMYYS